MITCPVCSRGPKALGKSSVVQSMREPADVVVAGKPYVEITMIRRRQCGSCRRRWKTVETLIGGSERGFGKV